MKLLSPLALTFLIFAGCLAPPRHSDGTGGSSGQSSGGSGGSNKSSSRSGSSSSGGSSASNSGGASGGSSASGGVSSGGDSGGSGGQGSSSAEAGSSAASSATHTGGSAGQAGGTTATGGAAGKGGSGGGGGTTSSGGTTAASTATYSTAPTQCTFPSSWTVGQATYTTYTMPNPISGCGYNVTNNQVKNIVTPANFAAIPGNSPSDFNTRDRCGACIQVGNAVITIVDECPMDAASNNRPCTANPSGHMDLSNAAAGAGNVRGDPAVRGQNQWKYVPCPVNGNVIVRLKKGNNNEIFIENQILPIAAVTCNGEAASRTSYGAWHFGANVPGATCEVTDIAGRKIGITLGTVQNEDVDTKVQFPKCL